MSSLRWGHSRLQQSHFFIHYFKIGFRPCSVVLKLYSYLYSLHIRIIPGSTLGIIPGSACTMQITYSLYFLSIPFIFYVEHFTAIIIMLVNSRVKSINCLINHINFFLPIRKEVFGNSLYQYKGLPFKLSELII